MRTALGITPRCPRGSWTVLPPGDLSCAADLTGAATPFDPGVGFSVDALAISGSTVYLGGSFTSGSGMTARARLAAFADVARTSGHLTDWNPVVDSDEDQASARVGPTLQALRGRSIIRDRRDRMTVDLHIDVSGGRVTGFYEADHRLMELPILGTSARRIGAVDGRREECIRLLREGAAVLTFPEGTRAHQRRYRDRYGLSPFGHGFVRVALASQAPIVPVAVVGCEEEAPVLANPTWLRNLVRTHSAPLTPTLVVPLPVRYRLHFGEPIRVTGPPTEAAVATGVQTVRDALARLLADGLAARRHVFW